MNAYHCNIQICSAFATPLVGDTLFGHLCWAVRQRHGERLLETLLEGYTNGHPFAVIGSPFPKGYLPRPTVPQYLLSRNVAADINLRKKQKNLRWMPVSETSKSLDQWLDDGLCNDNDLLTTLGFDPKIALESHDLHQHNSLNRLTNTTGKGEGFAPYTQTRIWYHPEMVWQITIILDETRLSVEACKQLLTDIGLTGYGRDASSGLGKFDVISFDLAPTSTVLSHDYLALAPIALSSLQFETEGSFYQTKVRFGRHGNIGVHQGNPFKKPVLLADAGALLRATTSEPLLFAGYGLTGVSEIIPNTVHQGYAPLYPVRTGSSS